MARRQTKNRTGIPRIEDLRANDAWVGFSCIKCARVTTISVGNSLVAPAAAFESATWRCARCKYMHHSGAALPFRTWPKRIRAGGTPQALNFWLGFFRIHTESSAAYWKQCNVCARVQPHNAFSKHSGWGPLERQMECRACKGAINAVLNPKRTKQQLFESGSRRRAAELLIERENEPIDLRELFDRFDGKCFKTGRKLSVRKRNTWEVDHILPATYLYPMRKENACLLSSDANQNKKSQWPSAFFTANELVHLAKLTGANLELISRKAPVVNPRIDVNACVDRFLKMREKANVAKRVAELKSLLAARGLGRKLSQANRALLGLD